MKTEALRPGQRKALDIILERITNRQSKTAVVLPTRYGKSDLIRLVSLLSKEQNIASASIALSPSILLRNQLIQKEKINKMIFLYGLDDMARRVRIMNYTTECGPFTNGEYLLSATIQLATRNIDDFCILVDSQIYTSHLPVIIHIDECHETSEEKRRGELVERLEAAGALIVLYTATAIRADGEMIPGFEVDTLQEEDARRYVVSDAGDGKHNRIDVYEGERRVVELRAHHATTFKEAWEERPCPLCDLAREEIDVNLNDLSESEDSILLSECSLSAARKYLSKAVRNPVVIDKGVQLFIDNLRKWQRVNPNVGGIIFSCSDFDGEANRHAKEILAVIESKAPDLQSSIVTMKSEEGDEKSTLQIERFIGPEDGTGKGDILIVKQMGGAGLDGPRLKILLDLSPVRTISSVIQRIMRVATPWEGLRHATIITLADPLMSAIWKKCVLEEGGGTALSNVYGEMEKVNSYLKPKGGDPKALLEIVSAEISGFDDSRGHVGDLGKWSLIEGLLSRLPGLLTVYTKAQISELLTDFAPVLEPPKGREEALDSRIQNKRTIILQRVKDKAQSEAPYRPDNQEPYKERFRFWMNAAKSSAGVPLRVGLAEIVNASTLDVMLNYLVN